MMIKAGYSDNNEHLIKMVREKPYLYDLYDPDYLNKRLKDDAWNEIATKLRSSSLDVRKRWKNLRDTFARKYSKWNSTNRRGGPQSSWRHEKWAYYSQMSFISGTVRPRSVLTARRSCYIEANKRMTEYVNGENENAENPIIKMEDYEQMDPVELENDIADDNSQVLRNSITPSTVDCMPSSSNADNATIADSLTLEHAYQPEPMFSEEKLQHIVPRVHHRRQSDVNELFGQSVAAQLRLLPDDQQAWARFKMSEILFNAFTAKEHARP